MISSKHFPLVLVNAAGNYITVSCTDLQRLLRFPRLGLLIIYGIISPAVACVMFHGKNNNTMCQTEPAAELGQLRKEFVIDDLGVSQALRMTPVRLRSESAVTTSGNRTSLMAPEIYKDALLIAPTRASRQGREGARSFMEYGTIYTSSGS